MPGKSEKPVKQSAPQSAISRAVDSTPGAKGGKHAKKQRERTFTSVMFGNFLTAEVLRKNIGFISLVAVCMLLYIGNGYSSQQELLELSKLKVEAEDMKYKALIRSGELLEKSRQSRIEEHLRSIGDTTLQTATTPPYVIEVDTTE